MDADRAGQAVAACRRCEGHGLHAEALGRLHTLPRRRPDLSDNNAAERALRGIALGRKAWLFAGSDRGGERAALMYTLIQTARLNDIDPQAWLSDVLARINEHKFTELDKSERCSVFTSTGAARMRECEGFCKRRSK